MKAVNKKDKWIVSYSYRGRHHAGFSTKTVAQKFAKRKLRNCKNVTLKKK